MGDSLSYLILSCGELYVQSNLALRTPAYKLGKRKMTFLSNRSFFCVTVLKWVGS